MLQPASDKTPVDRADRDGILGHQYGAPVKHFNSHSELLLLGRQAMKREAHDAPACVLSTKLLLGHFVLVEDAAAVTMGPCLQ